MPSSSRASETADNTKIIKHFKHSSTALITAVSSVFGWDNLKVSCELFTFFLQFSWKVCFFLDLFSNMLNGSKLKKKENYGNGPYSALHWYAFYIILNYDDFEEIVLEKGCFTLWGSKSSSVYFWKFLMQELAFWIHSMR